MALAQSKITAQGQVSIPVSVMRQFGLAPGEVISWEAREGQLVIEKASLYSLVDVQSAVQLPKGLHKSEDEIREGIKVRMRTKHAGG